MADTNEPISTHPPSNPSKTITNGEYQATFYPGFVRKLVVVQEEKEVLRYEQGQDGEDRVFYLPPGYQKPWPCSTVELVRPGGARVLLQVTDGGQQVDRIVVELKAGTPDRVKGDLRAASLDAGVTLGDGEDPPPAPPCTLIIEDGPVLCPPMCPT